MNQKGIAKNILILLLIALLGVAGYLVKADKISFSKPSVPDDTFQGSLGDVKIGLADPLDPTVLREIQQGVGDGHQPWRLDPVQVAIADGRKYGFASDDTFRLVSKKFGEYAGTYIADVEVNHNDNIYTIRLIQPLTIGQGGIWVINSIGRNGR